MTKLLDETLFLSPKDAQTNIVLPFSVGQDYEELIFHFSYSPKVLEDREKARLQIQSALDRFLPRQLLDDYGDWEAYLPLHNLLTLSIDLDGCYLGCAHRQSPEQKIRISEGHSSPGFLRQAARSGAWRAVVNLHGIATEQLTCRVWVELYGDYREETGRRIAFSSPLYLV